MQSIPLVVPSLALIYYLLVVFSAIPLTAATETYNIVKEYAGSNFFNDWQFYDHFDNLTHGDAVFVSASVGASAKLAYVDTNNHAIIKVDNTTTVPFNQKRNTVRITSNERYGVGSLWIADMYHVPFGCSVWPAWWSFAPNWPTGGEIDTFEAVNLVSTAQMALHTVPGCTQLNQTQTSSSLITSTDCSHLTNSNQGCVVTNPSVGPSYGEEFAKNGGGVWVTEFAEAGISIWFFPRPSVPSVLSSNTSTVNISTLGTPTANWPSTGCTTNKFFEPQQLVFDITLCGDFAGAPAVFSQTCPGSCYNDYVIGPPSGYDNAYFEVGSVRVYGVTAQNTTVAVPESGAGNMTGKVGLTGGSVGRGCGGLGAVLVSVVGVVVGMGAVGWFLG